MKQMIQQTEILREKHFLYFVKSDEFGYLQIWKVPMRNHKLEQPQQDERQFNY